MKQHTLLFFSLIMLIFSCNAQKTEDESLTVNEYEISGLPALNKYWMPEDYDKIIVILNDLKKKNLKSLPRANSEKSKPYFDRIISEKNLEFINDTTISLQNNFFLLPSFSVFYGKLVYLYYQDSTSQQFYSKHQYYNEELVSIYIFGIKLTDKLFDFANLLLKSTKDEPNAQMKAGMENMSGGYFKTVMGLLDESTRIDVYKTKDLERLSAELKENITKNIGWLNSERREQLKEKLNQTLKVHKSVTIKNNLKAILKLL